MTLLEYCTENKLFMVGDSIRAKTLLDITNALINDGYNITRHYAGGNNRVDRIDAIHEENNTIAITINDSRKMRLWREITTASGRMQDTRFFSMTGGYDKRCVLPMSCYEVTFSNKYTAEERLKKYNICPIELARELATAEKTQKTKSIKIPESTTEQKDPTMSINFNAQDILDQNKDAAMIAAKIAVGEVAVQQLVKIIKPKLPIMARGYADMPIFDILIANLVIMAIRQYAPANEKAGIVADAMLLAAMQKQMRDFDIPGMINDFVSKVDVTAITSALK